MDNFDLKKFLTENKLTKTSVLREGLEENKTYTDRDEWRAAVKAKYPDAKPNLKFGDDSIYNDSEGNRVAMWSNDTNTGAIEFTAKPKDQPDLIYPKGSRMDETKKEALKAKIKEMIIAELDGSAVTDEDYDFVAEGEDFEDGETGEVGEKDYEDYQELKKFLNTLSTTKNPNAYTDDAFNYNSEIDPDGPDEDYYETEGDGEIDDYDTEYDLGEGKFKLKEFFIDEAKKDEEAPAEDAPEEEVDATLDTTATGEDFNIDTSAVDPNIKAVQDALTQAQAAAKNINDDKLTQQIGNTITMFTRTHIANTESSVNEGKSLTADLTPEEKKIYDKVKNTITYTGMKKYNSKEYSKRLQKALQAAAMHNEESER
jgi:hypothetical protein